VYFHETITKHVLASFNGQPLPVLKETAQGRPIYPALRNLQEPVHQSTPSANDTRVKVINGHTGAVGASWHGEKRHEQMKVGDHASQMTNLEPTRPRVICLRRRELKPSKHKPKITVSGISSSTHTGNRIQMCDRRLSMATPSTRRAPDPMKRSMQTAVVHLKQVRVTILSNR
jgi:hypothetical protein